MFEKCACENAHRKMRMIKIKINRGSKLVSMIVFFFKRIYDCT